jgi:hypothetical protein
MIVAGNGESRLSIAVPYESVGCNALHRDYRVRHLVCVDPKPLAEAIKSQNTKDTKIYTRKEWCGFTTDDRICIVPDLPHSGNLRPDEPRHWGAGTYAVLLASSLSREIKMIGFDLYDRNGYINNIYKDSLYYDSSTSYQPDPSYTIYQIHRVFTHFRDKYYVIYNKTDWSMPKDWNLPNVEFKNIDLF